MTEELGCDEFCKVVVEDGLVEFTPDADAVGEGDIKRAGLFGAPGTRPRVKLMTQYGSTWSLSLMTKIGLGFVLPINTSLESKPSGMSSSSSPGATRRKSVLFSIVPGTTCNRNKM